MCIQSDTRAADGGTAVTADEVLEACAATIGQPLNRCQTRIGFPRETSIGGPLFKAMAAEIGKHSFPLGGPFFLIGMSQKEELEKELGRPICNSGDCLFGMILISLWLPEDGEHDPKSAVDLRWIYSQGTVVSVRAKFGGCPE